MFDIFVLIICVVLGFLGFRKGFISTVLQLIGLILATFCASQFYQVGAHLIARFISLSNSVLSVAGWFFVFILVYLFCLLLAAMLKSLVKSLSLIWLDRSLGFLFGICEGLVILCVFVWVLNVFPEIKLAAHFESRSASYALIHKIELKTSQIFGLEDNLTKLRGNLRKIFLLPDDSAPAETFFNLPTK